MAQWMQCDWIQQSPVWADSTCSIADTHDGFDEDSHRKAKEAQARHDKDFRSLRQRLRDVIEQAWGEPGPVAAEVKEAAAPYVEQLESGALRINYAALERRNTEVMAQVLDFERALRAEYEARIVEADEEEEILLIWN